MGEESAGFHSSGTAYDLLGCFGYFRVVGRWNLSISNVGVKVGVDGSDLGRLRKRFGKYGWKDEQ